MHDTRPKERSQQINPDSMEVLRNLYDRNAANWDAVAASYRHKVPEWAARVVSESGIDFRRHLDLGCANGLVAAALQRAGFSARRIGVDFSPKMVVEAQESGLYDRVLEADLSHGFPDGLNGKFDLITALSVIEYIAQPEFVLRDIRDYLTSNGVALLTFRKTVAGLPTNGEPKPTALTSDGGICVFHYDKIHTRNLVESAGLTVQHIHDSEAYRRDEPVIYWYVVARRSSLP